MPHSTYSKKKNYLYWCLIEFPHPFHMCEKEQGICMCVTRGGRGGIRQINTATKYFYWLIKKKTFRV